MINKFKTITSDKLAITYSSIQMCVIVATHPFGPQRMFGGYARLEERFDEMYSTFSEAITFEDAVDYFTLKEKI